MLSKQRTDISKQVFIAPALNQSQLNRYRYTMNMNKDVQITRENYHDYFIEEEYQKQITQPAMKKANLIDPIYMKVMSDLDYTSELPRETDDILVIH